MDDIQFFDTILPSTGLRCIALVKPSGAWHHLWGTSNGWLANVSKQIDTAKNVDVYYGCASFTPKAQDAPSAGGGRKQVNVALVRAFWVDLDVGVSEPNKPPKYATQKDAATAILAFAVRTGLPKPFLVNSGWGVHAYWPLEADTSVSDWKPVAEALKRALRAAGVRFDPSRTADEASVLRPPGTRNHKRQPKRVRVVLVGVVTTLAVIRAALAAWMQAPASPSIATAQLSAQNAALGGGLGPDPSSALLMADHCAVIGMMRDTRGNLDQPTWYYSLGVLLHTDEAPAICHTWSDGHPNYSYAETQANLARLAKHGATTCEKLAEHQPAVCAACPHFGKITSPIQLGRPRVQQASVETVTEQVTKGGFVKETTAKIDLPYGYGERIEEGRRVLTHDTKTTDKDGVVSVKTDVVANTLFWGVTRLWDEDGAVFEFEMLTREGTRRFEVKGGTIGGGGRELSTELAKNEIVARRGGGAALHNYMSNWLEQLSRASDQVKAHRSFGWAPDGEFVLGDTLARPDGTEARAILTGIAKSKQAAVTRKGDLETWVALVDRAYNAPGQEAFQFQIGCAFAAPLLSLMQQVNGVTVYSHTDGSGVGKTTVQKVGLSAWGSPDDMMLAQDKVTANMMWGYLGAYNSLPVVYDELTNIPIKDVSELVFSVSSGRAKERMTATGEARSNNSNWSTILLASGNKLLSEMLALHRANTEAEISRLFEFTLTHDPHLSVVEANAIFPQFAHHYGHAGHVFAHFIAKHRVKVTKALHDEQRRLITKLELTQVERHWSALFAAVVVALHICRALKLLAFEVATVEAWIETQLAGNRGQRTEAVADYSDLLAQMVDDLWEGVLVTQGLGDLRSNIPVNLLKLPRPSIIGRRVYPTTTQPISELIIARTAIQKWCAEKVVSPKTLFAEGISRGWVHPEIKRLCPGRGTREYQTSDNVWCWRFFPDVMEGVAAQPITQLNVVQGGKP